MITWFDPKYPQQLSQESLILLFEISQLYKICKTRSVLKTLLVSDFQKVGKTITFSPSLTNTHLAFLFSFNNQSDLFPSFILFNEVNYIWGIIAIIQWCAFKKLEDLLNNMFLSCSGCCVHSFWGSEGRVHPERLRAAVHRDSYEPCFKTMVLWSGIKTISVNNVKRKYQGAELNQFLRFCFPLSKHK